MHLLNEKSILNCDEQEKEKHNQEIQDILTKLSDYPNFDCAAIIKYFDEANKKKEPAIKQCNLYNCSDMIQYSDIKNGVDFTIIEGFLTFICYGSEYEYNNQLHLVTTGIQIRPYTENKEFIYLDITI